MHAVPHEGGGPEAPGAPAPSAAARPGAGPWPPAPVLAPGSAPASQLPPSDRPGTWAPGGQGGHALSGTTGPTGPTAPTQPYFEPWSGGEWDDVPRREPGPSRPWALASVVFAVAVAPLGLVFGLVALSRARREGASRVLAVVGVVLACVVMVVSVVWGVAWLDHVVQLAAACRRVGPGEYLTGDGSVVTCS